MGKNILKKESLWDFPGGPVVKNPPCEAGYIGLIPGQGTKIPHGAEAAAKSLQSCPDSATPQTAAHQAPPSLGFSRQEHWSGLPFPSPMHEGEK